MAKTNQKCVRLSDRVAKYIIHSDGDRFYFFVHISYSYNFLYLYQ